MTGPPASVPDCYDALVPNHKRKATEYYLEARTPAGRAGRVEKIPRSIKTRIGSLAEGVAGQAPEYQSPGSTPLVSPPAPTTTSMGV